MRNKKVMYSLVSLLIVLGLLLSGCSQQPTTPATTTPATAPTTAPAEDPAKAIKTAVETYFNDLGTNVKDSYKITEKDLKDALEKDPNNYAVLDVRKADAYAQGHIKGAINVPYGSDIATNLDKIRALAKDKTLIVACYTGQTAGQTDSLLNVAGIKTRSLNFGMGNGLEGKGWLGQKFPVVTDTTTMPDAPAVTSPNKAIDDAVKNYFNNVPADSYKIDLPVLKDAIAKDADKYYIVDVRKAEDFAKGHIKGAVNVPYGPEIAKNLDSLKEKSQGKTLVVYCYTGQTAGQTDSLLNLLGITTKSLNFGFGMDGFNKGWSADKTYEIVK